MHAELVVEKGNSVGSKHTIRTGQRFLIGRSGVTITLKDALVSRRHAQVELRPNGLYLADLGSRNGTFLRGTRLEPYLPTRVLPSDAIVIGGHLFRAMTVGDEEATRRQDDMDMSQDEPLVSPREFELLGCLGAGAYGRVYSAHQRLMDRRVALKFLNQSCTGTSNLAKRFVQEGRLACRIQSPYVVEVYDIRASHDRIYLVMELVDGPSLRDLLASNKTLPIPNALKLAEDVARGLASVHEGGVIHRDIKPSNIMLDPAAGVAKLTDFGVAKDLASLAALTPQDFGIGSLPYAPPEQVLRHGEVDARADIYGLGATLYHMISGQPPFGLSPTLDEVGEVTPTPLSERDSSCPPFVCAGISRMLAKEPAKRPAGALPLAETLRMLRERHYPDYAVPSSPDAKSWITQTQPISVAPRSPDKSPETPPTH